MKKNEWRNLIKKARHALSEEERTFETKLLMQSIIEDPRWQRAHTVLLYLSFGSELDTTSLIHAAWHTNKTVAIPVCFPNYRMVPVHFTSETPLKKTKLGLLEIPQSACQPIDISKIDFCLIPGLAFDAYGTRIGYGAGYYDRFLPTLPETCTKIAACFTCQLINEKLPYEATDFHIDEIHTPMLHFYTRKKSSQFS